MKTVRLIIAAIAAAVFAVDVGAQEIIAGVGTTTWRQCGTVGCWRQPPEPYRFDLTTGGWILGGRLGWAELAYRDLGRVSVQGVYVLDADYDSNTQTIRDGAKRIPARSAQHTAGVSIALAPRFQWGNVTATPILGAIVAHQRQWFWNYDGAGKVTGEGQETNSTRLAPFAGLRLGARFDQLELWASWEQFGNVRYVNSLATRPRQVLAGLAYQFKGK